MLSFYARSCLCICRRRCGDSSWSLPWFLFSFFCNEVRFCKMIAHGTSKPEICSSIQAVWVLLSPSIKNHSSNSTIFSLFSRQNLLEHALRPWGHGGNHAALCCVSRRCPGAAWRSKHLFHWVSQPHMHVRTQSQTERHLMYVKQSVTSESTGRSLWMCLRWPNLTSIISCSA